jgi:hypothetical protein
MTIEKYLAEAIASFDRDPADTRFQEGFLAALIEVQKFLENSKKEVDTER